MAKEDLLNVQRLEAYHDELMKDVIALLAHKEGDYEDLNAGNLTSWKEDVSEVSNNWAQTIRSTAGDDPIDTAYGGILSDIVAKSDFKCDALKTSGYNLLRLVADGGVATQLGNAYVVPVPHLELGAFGDATKNNGLLLTDRDGVNITDATVRFQALANGVPTSANAGVECAYEDVTYNDETYRTYVTPGAGWLIISGITWADTCAHLAWEDWYDRFIDPQDEEDSGDIISLAALFTAAPNGTGKFLIVGTGSNAAATRATRISDTQMTVIDPVARIASPAWVNELQEDEESYKHSLTIPTMKDGGQVAIEGSAQTFVIEGKVISYIDTNAEAIAGAVRYELATPATATVTLEKTRYVLNDCGIEMKEGAEGEAYFRSTYSQNVADALSQIAKVKLDVSLSVVAEALVKLCLEQRAVLTLLTGNDNAVLPALKVQSIEAKDVLSYGAPDRLESKTAGAPSAANVPTNWDEKKSGVWDGCPRRVGQEYFDRASKKIYKAATLTGSTSDWVPLN